MQKKCVFEKWRLIRKTVAIGIVVLFFAGSYAPAVQMEHMFIGEIQSVHLVCNQVDDLRKQPVSSVSQSTASGDLLGESSKTHPSLGDRDGQWWDTAWGYRKPITIDHSQVAANLTHFPVLISLDSDTDLSAHAQSDGDDLVFTDDTGVQLVHELEYYDDTTGTFVAWVNVMSLSNVSDTVLYLYYGNPSCESQENPSGVWDTGYVMVQHLNETSGVHYDSSSYGNDGVCYGGVAQNAVGRIDGADDFDAVDDYVDVGDLDVDANWAVSFWAKSNASVDVVIYPVGLACVGAEGAGIGMGGTWNKVNNDFYVYDGNSHCIHGGPSIVLGMWYYVTVVKNNSLYTIYVNGSSVASGNSLDGIAMSALTIGKRPDAIPSSTFGGYFDGTIDEVQVSKIGRSDTWIETSYHNQYQPHSFYEIGDHEVGLMPIISSESPANCSVNIPLSLSQLTFNLSDAQGDTMNYTVETLPAVGTGFGIEVPNGSYNVPIAGLVNSMVYMWFVNVTDGVYVTNRTFIFTTVSDKPVITNESPENGATNVAPNPLLQADVVDAQGDSVEWWITSNLSGSWSVLATGSLMDGNGIVSVSSGMNVYGRTYYWSVNATDSGSGKWTNETYSFVVSPVTSSFSSPDPPDGDNDVYMEISDDGVRVTVSVVRNGIGSTDVSFYWENGSKIGTDWDVAGGERASLVVDWLNFYDEYSWYVEDAGGTSSPIYGFETASTFAVRPNWTQPECGNPLIEHEPGECLEGASMLYDNVTDTFYWFYNTVAGMHVATDTNLTHPTDGHFDKHPANPIIPCGRSFHSSIIDDRSEKGHVKMYVATEGGIVLYICEDNTFINWTRHSRVLTGPTCPGVEKVGDKYYLMAQTGGGLSFYYSDDGINWTADSNNPVILSSWFEGDGGLSTPELLCLYDVNGDEKFYCSTEETLPSPDWRDFYAYANYYDVVDGDFASTWYAGNNGLLAFCNESTPFKYGDEWGMEGEGPCEGSLYYFPERYPDKVFGLQETSLCAHGSSPCSDWGIAWTTIYNIKSAAPVISNELPKDTSFGVNLNPTLQVTITDHQGDNVSWWMKTNATGSWSILDSGYLPIGNGTVSFVPSVMDTYSTTYYWSVNVTDPDGSGIWVNETFCFTVYTPLNEWVYRKAIVINHSLVDEDLVDFPMLIEFEGDGDLVGHVQSGFEDVLFMDGSVAWMSGSACDRFAHEIERGDSGLGDLIAWVKVPFVSSSADTVFYMYYGNPSCICMEDVSGTWNSEYVMVQHLEETAGTHEDSTSYGFDGVAMNGTGQDATGYIDGADNFDGVDDYVAVGDLDVDVDWTVSFWAKSDTITKPVHYPMGLGADHGIGMGGTYPAYKDFYVYDGVNSVHSGSPVVTGVWYYVCVVKNGLSYSIFVNGSLAGSGTLIDLNIDDLNIGRRSNNFGHVDSTIDEVRVSRTVRSAGWIQTKYLNQVDPASFVEMGMEEEYVASDVIAPVITAVTVEFSTPKDTVIGWENITCQVTDNTHVNQVKVNLTYPDLHTENVSMMKSGDLYYYNTTLSAVGSYSYFIWANDTSTNTNRSSAAGFVLPPNWDITSDGVCNGWDVTAVAYHWMSFGDPGWIRADITNDGTIDGLDVTFLSVHWLDTWS